MSAYRAPDERLGALLAELEDRACNYLDDEVDDDTDIVDERIYGTHGVLNSCVVIWP